MTKSIKPSHPAEVMKFSSKMTLLAKVNGLKIAIAVVVFLIIFIMMYNSSQPKRTLRMKFGVLVNSSESPDIFTHSPMKDTAKGQLPTTINVTNVTISMMECKLPTPDEGGPIKPNLTLESIECVEQSLEPLLKAGGWFEPANCIATHHVAIIVPFRDRYAQLSKFLKNIHPFLMKQNIAYRIFVVEQTNGQAFNRAALMNIGYLEALKYYKWDCFIFHDVDLLPLDDRNLYTCPRQPRHMSVSIDVFHYKLPYENIFGGVSAMTREQFRTVNGYSNLYFGWGGEDDDMYNRLRRAKLYIARYPINIARYMMLNHQKERANPKRFEKLLNGINNSQNDGLNTIKYKIYNINESPTFTWCLAELKMTEQR